MKLSIIIVSYNTRELLVQCIESIYNYLKGVSFELIVIDNASADDSCEAIASRFKGVRLIRNTSNLGFSKANNQGIKNAQGDSILLLNPDTLLIDNSLEKLLAYLTEQHDPIIVAPRLLNGDKSLQVSAWKDKTLAVMALELVRIFIDRYPLSKFIQPKKVDNVAGAAMVFRKKMVEDIGYLDDELFWMEDFDFSYRVRQQGGRIMYFPDSAIVHYGGKSTDTNLKVAYANANISKLKFYKKHGSAIEFALASVIMQLHIISRMLLFMLLSPIHNKFRKYSTAYVYSLRRFWIYILLNDGSLH